MRVVTVPLGIPVRLTWAIAIDRDQFSVWLQSSQTTALAAAGGFHQEGRGDVRELGASAQRGPDLEQNRHVRYQPHVQQQ